MNDWTLLAPIGVILCASIVVVFADLVLPHKDRYLLPWMTLGGCIFGLLSIAQTQTTVWDQMLWFYGEGTVPAPGVFDPRILGGAFCLDGFGISIWVLACLAGALATLVSPAQAEDSLLSSGEYHGLILLAVAGMMLLGISHDWVTLLISLEIMSISTYILAGSNRTDLRSNESALKYLILGAFSTAFMLMGMAFYYGAYGSISLHPSDAFQALPQAERGTREYFLILSMGLVFVGAFFKTGAAPFHFWIPDVYEGAPTAITGLMAFGVKAAAFAVVARLCFETFGAARLRELWIPALLTVSVLTMVLGNLLAMRQSNVKRMLSYSAIAHTGYLLLAFLVVPGAGDSAAMSDHLQSVVFYLLTYGVMTLGAFGVVALIREDGRPLESIDDYAGLAKEHPGIALCMAMFMLSLAGLPPLGGFFAKFMIFRDTIAQGASGNRPAIIAGAVIGILTSVVSLYYYLRVVVVMYMSPQNASESPEAGVVRCRYAWTSNLLIFAAGAVTLILGLAPGIVLGLLMK